MRTINRNNRWLNTDDIILLELIGLLCIENLISNFNVWIVVFPILYMFTHELREIVRKQNLSTYQKEDFVKAISVKILIIIPIVCVDSIIRIFSHDVSIALFLIALCLLKEINQTKLEWIVGHGWHVVSRPIKSLNFKLKKQKNKKIKKTKKQNIG